MFETCRALLKDMVTDEDSVITLFYGEGVSEELAKQVTDMVTDEYDDFDVELQFGGQPVYPFVFAVE
jgi:dihydroxyacetone kinase-like predicted kinase